MKKPQGFAALSAERRRELAILGGQAVHKKGVAHEFTSEEAKVAGKKGGQASARAKALRKAQEAFSNES